MDRFGSHMPSFTGNGEGPPQRPQSQPQQQSGGPTKTATGTPAKSHNGCTDVKPRLTKEQHDILEAHFQTQNKPSTSTKKGFAETLNVPVDKINNWFQNRRAKVKQDHKKMINQYNMNMGIYGPPQIPMVNSQFPSHVEQPQPPMSQDFYGVNADISPTCLPVESIERPSTLDLGSQISLHQPFDMHHSLRSIPEADRSTSYGPNTIMQSFMAATAGASSYMQNTVASHPPHEPGFAYDTSNLSHTFPGDMAFSISSDLPNETASLHDPFQGFPDFSGLDYASLTTTNTSNSAEAQNSAGSISSEPSPFSGTQSTATRQSSGGPNASSVTSIVSAYSGWTDEQNSGPDTKPSNQCDDPFEGPYNLPQGSASEHTLPFWASNGQGQSFSQADFYQHSNDSAHAVMASPGHSERKLSTGPLDFEKPPVFGDDGFARRNSSTTNLANNIEAIHIQNSDDFKQPDQPSSIAARRHKRPTALNPNTLRSASYSNGMPSPGGNNNEHTLRRIRSSGIASAAGRIQKPNPGSAQRSPMTLTFSEAAASPKFARVFSSSSTATIGQGGSLAPPTPLTPNETPRFPSWQSNTVIRTHPPMPDHSSPESLNTQWSVEPQSAGLYSNTASPPSTPLDLGQLNQARLTNDLYRDTPPQSAPATQQSFPRATFMHPPQMRSGFHSTSDLTIAQPKPSHFRRPSLPDAGHVPLDESHMQYPVQYEDYHYDHYKDISLQGISHNVPFAPPIAMPEFLVHEYTPPHGVGPHAHMLRRTTEPQPKQFIFANQSQKDFRS